MTGRRLLMIVVLMSALGGRLYAGPGKATAPGTLTGPAKNLVAEVKRRVFDQINRDRKAAGISPVQWDNIAAQAGDRHSQEMLQYHYGSHWNMRGLKPYTRYSLAGGTDYVEENISVRNVTPAQPYSPPLQSVVEAALELHAQMMAERPPNDGHRRNILNPAHTHAGIGIAVDGSGLRMTEEFLNRYVTFPEGLVSTASLGSTLRLRGRLINPADTLESVNLYYEPFPRPMALSELAGRSDYGFPAEHDIYRPVAKEGFRYSDGSKGDVRIGQDGTFECPLKFRAGKPGLYTLVVWVRPHALAKALPATGYTIQVIAEAMR